MIVEKTLEGEIIEHESGHFITDVEKDSPIHLCWNCKNGYATKCPKITDLQKGTIDSYNFIKSGYQLVEDGNIIKFIVSACDNFEVPEQKSQEELERAKIEAKKAMNELIMDFYDVDTVEDALRIRENRRARGVLEKKLNREKIKIL